MLTRNTNMEIYMENFTQTFYKERNVGLVILNYDISHL